MASTPADATNQVVLQTMQERTTPADIFASDTCTIQTLTISDQHATLLLTHSNPSQSLEDGDTDTLIKSLLKLAVVPFHRTYMDRSAKVDEQTDKTKASIDDVDPEESKKLLSFLSSYNFKLTSESGAEYSYYDATPKPGIFFSAEGMLDYLKNAYSAIRSSRLLSRLGIGSAVDAAPPSLGNFKAELISPATERQIIRSMPSPGTCLIDETPDIYEKVTRPHIQSVVDTGSLAWLQNIVEGKKEKERLLLDTDHYILNIDTKWRSHPDPLTVSREEWYGHKATDNLYCLAIFKQDLKTLRDFRGEHIPILRTIIADGTATIERVYGIKRDQIRIFVHYQPQFYHFHVHFTRLENEIGCQVERGHLVTDIIQNLEMDSEFYMKRTITYRLRVTDPLYQKIASYSAEKEKGEEKAE